MGYSNASFQRHVDRIDDTPRHLIGVNPAIPKSVPPVPEQAKNCPGCQTVKPVSEFHKNRTKADGLQDYCKECKLAYGRQSRTAKHQHRPEPKPTAIIISNMPEQEATTNSDIDVVQSINTVEAYIRCHLDLFDLSADDLELIKAVKDIRTVLTAETSYF